MRKLMVKKMREARASMVEAQETLQEKLEVGNDTPTLHYAIDGVVSSIEEIDRLLKAIEAYKSIKDLSKVLEDVIRVSNKLSSLVTLVEQEIQRSNKVY